MMHKKRTAKHTRSTKTLYRAKLLKFPIDKRLAKWYTKGIEFKKEGIFYYETLFDTLPRTDDGALCYVSGTELCYAFPYRSDS